MSRWQAGSSHAERSDATLHLMLAQIMILLAGLLPNPQVTTDTTGIFLSICSLAYMAPLGLASAASTRVANALGAKR